jgi:hypothetical protein
MPVANNRVDGRGEIRAAAGWDNDETAAPARDGCLCGRRPCWLGVKAAGARSGASTPFGSKKSLALEMNYLFAVLQGFGLE